MCVFSQTVISPSSALGRCYPETWVTAVCSGFQKSALAPPSWQRAIRDLPLWSTRSWPAACFHWRTAASRPGSAGCWPPGPDSHACSPSGHPAAACRPGRWRWPGRGGCRMPWEPILWREGRIISLTLQIFTERCKTHSMLPAITKWQIDKVSNRLVKEVTERPRYLIWKESLIKKNWKLNHLQNLFPATEDVEISLQHPGKILMSRQKWCLLNSRTVEGYLHLIYFIDCSVIPPNNTV